MDFFGVDGVVIVMGGLAAVYIYYLVEKKRAAAKFVRRFTGPFAPELQAELSHENGSPLEAGDYHGVFVIGSDGYSVRFRIALGQTAAVQFLKPKTALPRFAPGAEFSVAQGKEIVGKGKVL